MIHTPLTQTVPFPRQKLTEMGFADIGQAYAGITGDFNVHSLHAGSIIIHVVNYRDIYIRTYGSREDVRLLKVDSIEKLIQLIELL